jgi:PhzF family phenazine biosynthesis protein
LWLFLLCSFYKQRLAFMTTVYELDVFTKTVGQGNPAGVVLEADGLTTTEMQYIAAKTVSETAFVLHPTRPGAALRLRYFSPKSEMNLCGHATIATLWLLAEKGLLAGTCVLETPAGLLEGLVEIELGRLTRALLEQPLPTYQELVLPVEQVAQALGIGADKIIEPIVTASVGRPKLMIPLADYKVLDACERGDSSLDELCKVNSLTGLYPYTCRPRNPVTLEARQFPYNVGFVEDPVTGVALAALGGYLVGTGKIPHTPPVTRLTIEQGHAMGCPGRAEVHIEMHGEQISRVQIGGEAVLVGVTEY